MTRAMLLLLITLVAPAALVAQAAEYETVAAAQIANLLPTNCVLSGAYEEIKTQEGLQAPLHSAGSFIFDCKQGLLWYIATPLHEAFVYTAGSTHYRVDEAGNSEALDSRAQQYLGNMLVGLISADIDYLDKNFNLQALRDADTKIQQAKLLPKRKAVASFLQAITLQKNAEEVVINMQQKNGASTITIRELMAADVADSLFCEARLANMLMCEKFVALVGTTQH
jgi:hypothetical protein